MPHHFDADLDITRHMCPMTYVRTRLALDALHAGQVLRVRLRGADAAASVPRSAAAHGDTVIGSERLYSGDTLLWLRRKL